ncbi:ABC transporter transmembrane domain-containing protein [Pseudomonas turukhanskensis]|uniref:Toxin ABC transporter n=1 Tax=Pseudomonas turukhanskensis TaxID=1806536 RepID=A0A9W6NGQ4_9PSED|nr:ABC transporter transmembrane domain-containing protein [Pseudomonas turukhanskensis]GLK91044.1 toxin ABC transporter [Pseudomonas turukhanskensis]
MVNDAVRGQRSGLGRLDVVAVSLVIHVLALALPLALLQIYDRILPSQSFGTAVVLVAGVGAAIVLEAMLRYGRTALFAHVAARYESETTVRIFDRLLKADIDAVERLGTASIIDGVRSVAQVRDIWSGSAAAAFYEVPFVVVYIGLIAYIGGWLALIPTTLFFVALALTLLVKGKTEAALQRVEGVDRKRRDLMWAAFAGVVEVKSRGAEPAVSGVYNIINGQYMDAAARLEALGAWVRENAALLGQLSTVLIVIFGAISVIEGQLTTGALSACTLLAGRSIGPAMLGLGYLTRLSQARNAQAKIDELLDLPIGKGASADTSAVITDGAFTLKGADGQGEILNVAAGDRVHVSSADATYTSKLLAMIAGTCPEEGVQVAIDGHPLTSFSPAALRQGVSLVPRHPALLPGTVLNNLTLFDSRYNQLARDYAEALGLLPFLARFHHGVLTEIGGLGTEQFDEGVYQRIALIRALVRQPRVLLLDYAGTGLDLDGQKRLVDLLHSLGRRTTVLIASNKPTLIASCDRSVNLDRGTARVR